MSEAAVRELRDDLAALAVKFEKLSKEKGFRIIGAGTAGILGDALCDLNAWMGWEEE